MGIIVVSIAQSKTMQILQQEAKFLNRSQRHDLEVEWWLLKKEKAKNHNEKGMPTSNNPLLAVAMNKIQTYFRFHVSHDLNGILHNEFEFYHQLSPSLQFKIVNSVFRNYMQKFQVFFQNIKEEGFLREIIIRMNPKLFYYEQKIVKRGTTPRGLYFMLAGSVKVSYLGHAMTILPENSFFGDSFILGQNSDLDYVVCSETNLKCLFIDRRNFFEACERYHDTFNYFQKFAYQRREYFKEIKRGIKHKIKTLSNNMNTSLHEFKPPDYILDMTPEEKASQEQPAKKPGSFLKKKWAEDGEKMKILNESALSSSCDENVVYVDNVEIPEDIYSKGEKSGPDESCELQQQYFRSTHADFLPNFNRTNASYIFGKRDSHEYSTSNDIGHAHDVPVFSKSLDTKQFFKVKESPQKFRKYDNQTNKKKLKFQSVNQPDDIQENEVSIHSDDSQPSNRSDDYRKSHKSNKSIESKKELNRTIDNKPSLRQILDFYDKLDHRRKRFLSTRIKSTDNIDSDPSTSIDSGDYSSTDGEGGNLENSDYEDLDDDELNNSMEVPLEPIPHDIFDIEEVEGFIGCLESRVEMLHCKLGRIAKTSRNTIMEDWKRMNRTKNKYHHKYGFLDKLDHDEAQNDHNENIIILESDIDTHRILNNHINTSPRGHSEDVFMLDTKETERNEKK